MIFENHNKNIWIRYGEILFVLYILVLSYLVFLAPQFGRDVIENRNYNITPFKTIRNFYLYGDAKMNIINLFGNVVAFIPMGFLGAVFFDKNHFLKATALTMFGSGIIEVVQYELYVGTFDVDDIILNTLGGVVGAAFFCILKKFLKNSTVGG